MAPSTEPTALLSPLHGADGSATYSQNGYTVIGAVNGPLEVSRRDELPEEAAVDVIVRPAAGVGGLYNYPSISTVKLLICAVLGIRERHLESILQSTLRQLILVHNFPRTLIQVTLQITTTPENENASSKLVQASSVSTSKARLSSVERLIEHIQNLPILPALLQTAILALLSASMPLSMTLTSVFLALVSKGSSRTVIRNPTLLQSQSSTSVHVLAFSSHGDLLVVESEGTFTLDDWEAVYEAGKAICCDDSEDEVMQDQEVDHNARRMDVFVKSALQGKVTADLHWKG